MLEKKRLHEAYSGSAADLKKYFDSKIKQSETLELFASSSTIERRIKLMNLCDDLALQEKPQIIIQNITALLSNVPIVDQRTAQALRTICNEMVLQSAIPGKDKEEIITYLEVHAQKNALKSPEKPLEAHQRAQPLTPGRHVTKAIEEGSKLKQKLLAQVGKLKPHQKP